MLKELLPRRALLASNQTLFLQALDEAGKPCAVSWECLPAELNGLTSAPTDVSETAVYVAPVVTSERQVTIVASSGGMRATASLVLSPKAVSILPEEVELVAGQSIKFHAVVAGESDGLKPTWIVTPPIGEIDQDGSYHAPKALTDSHSLLVTVADGRSRSTATAKLKLTAPPWTGPGMQLLGLYLLTVFSLVFVLIGLWPETLPGPEAARANRIEASQISEATSAAVRAAELEIATQQEATDQLRRSVLRADLATPPSPPTKPPGPAGAAVPPAAPVSSPAPSPAAPSLVAQETRLRLAHERLEEVRQDAKEKQDELKAARVIEAKVTGPKVKTLMMSSLDREIDLLLIVLVAGALGGFIHMTQSYTEYVGQRALHERWAWWYAFRPFVGSALAMLFYLATRGGFLAVGASDTSAAQLSPFGIASVAALVGLFSRAASHKLAEVFDTLFKSDNIKSKDPLPKPPSAGSTSSAANPKAMASA